MVPFDDHPAALRRRKGVRRWLFGALLALPAAVPYVSHYLAAGEAMPTGFIQGDQPGYMAVAREYFESGLSWTYSNPFVPAYDGPAIYFQPHTFVLGLVGALSRLDPGFLFVLFGLAGAIVCARVSLALYEECAGTWDTAARAGALLFFWGGGILALGGALTSPLHTFRSGEAMLYGNLFRWDPFEGWWFLSFGRNLIMPFEAYYHALFLGAVLAFLRRRYFLSALSLLLLCASHPYSGSELLAILVLWAAAEGFVFAPSRQVRIFLGAALAIGALHCGYYLLFLPLFPEHRDLVQQWSKWWVLDWRSALFAYGPVGFFAVAGFFRRGALRLRQQRLLLLWACVALVLVKHELFTDHPIEPLHFTRGYVWTPLFLLGLPVVLGMVRKLLEPRRFGFRVALALFFLLFLLDNGLWLTAVGRGYLIEHVRTTAAQREVFRALNGTEFGGSAVLTPDRDIALLSTVYTPLRPWTTHLRYTGDDIGRREQVQDLLLRGRWSGAWAGRKLAVVLDRVPGSVADTLAVRALAVLRGRQRRVLENSRYLVVLVERAGEEGGAKENPP
jgi:hypothetical protein